MDQGSTATHSPVQLRSRRSTFLGAGRISDQVVAVDRVAAVHRVMPLSPTFDHRAVTGAEAGRFLAAVTADLMRAV